MRCTGLLAVAASLALLSVAAGCHKSDSDSGPAAASTISALDKEAADAVMAEINKHWVKSADGWVSAFNSGNQFAPNFLRQLRDITIAGVAPGDLDESDKLNGVQFAGHVNFNKTPSREVGDPSPVLADWGMNVTRAKGHWSQWVDVTPEYVAAQKVNGKWQVRQDTMLLSGTPPKPMDYASAGIRP